MSESPILEALAISKQFGDVRALNGVSLQLRQGTVHALLGENGAGKSTLVKCIMGYYTPDSGELLFDGIQARIASPQQATALGIGMVYQHFTLIPNMSIAENIVLSRPHLPAVINWPQEIAALEKRMTELPFRFDLRASVNSLSAGEKQKVEICKQLLLNAKVLILDEPTSVLTPTEADEVLEKIYQLTRNKELSVLMITHKFREVMKYADDVTVLRKGQYVGSAAVADVNQEILARMMVDEDMLTQPPLRKLISNTERLLQLDKLCVRNDQGLLVINSVDLDLQGGEIVGIAGVSGNGQKQLTEVLGGQRKPDSGQVLVKGTVFSGSRKEMNSNQFYCLPEEPLRNACVANMSVADNMVLRHFDSRSFTTLKIILRRSSVRQRAISLISRFGIRTSGPDQSIGRLSGGNVQRAVLARELEQELSVLVVSNPCFGLDFKAVAEIRSKILDARNRGVAVLLLSEDLDEILELADRFYVISGGRLVYQTTPASADMNTIAQHMGGH
ncbi:MAG: ABC transporter ATP-binding protein [Pseudomonadota bacterium]